MNSSTRPRVRPTVAKEQATRWAPAELSTPAELRTAAAGSAPIDPVPTLESVRAEAYAQGLAEGLERGREQARAQIETGMQALESAAEALGESQPEWLDTIERNIQTLAIAVARQVIQQEIKANPDQIRDVVANALSRFPVEESLTIRLNPGDLSLLSAGTLEGRGDPAAGRDIRWRPDDNIDPGSCVVEGPQRLVDGRVDKALLRIYHAMTSHD